MLILEGSSSLQIAALHPLLCRFKTFVFLSLDTVNSVNKLYNQSSNDIFVIMQKVWLHL